MKALHRALAIFVAIIGVLALLAAAMGGAIVESLAVIFTLGRNTGVGLFPLGAGVFVIYLVGIGLGLAVPQRPRAAATAMLPLGVIALLFGGPVAKIYGVPIVCAGTAILATFLRGKA